MSEKIPTIYEHTRQPAWGHGIRVEKMRDRSLYRFEHGGDKLIIERAEAMLRAVALPLDQAKEIDSRLRGRVRHSSRPSKAGKKGAKKGAVAAPGVIGVFATFDEQLATFERLFPGGFTGEAFTKDERGTPGEIGRKKGYKEAAIALARTELSKERFASATPEELFASARDLLSKTNIVHPIEGAIALGSLAEAARPAFVAALGDLLHGTGPFQDRFEKFVGAIDLRDKTGKARKATWPLVTIFLAASEPTKHVCVRPTAFQSQARLVGTALDYRPEPNVQTYARLITMVEALRDRLVAAGQAPRDLMDVYSFIWLTHAEKPVLPVVPAAPATPATPA